MKSSFRPSTGVAKFLLSAIGPNGLVRRALRKLGSVILVRVYSRFKSQSFSISVNECRFTMQFPHTPLDSYIIERIESRRDLEQSCLIATLIEPGMLVAEFGSCYGYFTLQMAHFVGNAGKVVAVEGLPNNIKTLQHNLRINGIDNVKVVPAFIARGPENVEFLANEVNPYPGIHRLKHGESIPGAITVPTTSYSEVVKLAGQCPAVVFCDIEGFEVDLIEDYAKSHGLGCDCMPIFVIEIHPTFYEGERDEFLILQLLDLRGFRIRRLTDRIIAFPTGKLTFSNA